MRRVHTTAQGLKLTLTQRQQRQPVASRQPHEAVRRATSQHASAARAVSRAAVRAVRSMTRQSRRAAARAKTPGRQQHESDAPAHPSFVAGATSATVGALFARTLCSSPAEQTSEPARTAKQATKNFIVKVPQKTHRTRSAFPYTDHTVAARY